jgi:hypothetical protein
LKKRTKKLLRLEARAGVSLPGIGQGQNHQSFLLLFFKKASLALAAT